MISTTVKTILSLFCRHGFKSQFPRHSWPGNRRRIRYSPWPLKAGYTAHSVSEQREGDQFLTGSSAPHCRFHPVPLDIHQPQRDAIGVRQSRVSTARGSVLHAIEARPQALTSSIHPKLGVRSKHQRLHRYARLRIFRPVLGIACTD